MKSLRTASIRTQILVLAALLIILVSGVAATTEPFIYGRHEKGVEIGLLAGRIERVIDEFQQARSTNEEKAVFELAATLGVSVERISPSAMTPKDIVQAASPEIPRRVRGLLEKGFFESLLHLFNGITSPGSLVVGIDAERALLFHLPAFPNSLWFFPAVASGILKIVVPLIVLAYVGSWLIRPIARFAAAAEHASTDDSLEQPFTTEGASEIRSLASSLNVMRGRILEMAGSRTRMLSSISHDLRTPLTRLRMRAELCEHPELQRKMLEDLTALDTMINESLAFLTNTLHNVPSRKVDLSSLLQTIATDFTDTGVDVRFSGPRRLKYVCRPQAMIRAISNLVENATRYATRVDIELRDTNDDGIIIRVSDNGPGLTDALKQQVLEPFFKANDARTAGTGGFGLGLPTAEGIIKKGHGGTFALLDRKPGGLIVEISLPSVHLGGSGRLSAVRSNSPTG